MKEEKNNKPTDSVLSFYFNWENCPDDTRHADLKIIWRDENNEYISECGDTFERPVS